MTALKGVRRKRSGKTQFHEDLTGYSTSDLEAWLLRADAPWNTPSKQDEFPLEAAFERWASAVRRSAQPVGQKPAWWDSIHARPMMQADYERQEHASRSEQLALAERVWEQALARTDWSLWPMEALGRWTVAVARAPGSEALADQALAAGFPWHRLRWHDHPMTPAMWAMIHAPYATPGGQAWFSPRVPADPEGQGPGLLSVVLSHWQQSSAPAQATVVAAALDQGASWDRPVWSEKHDAPRSSNDDLIYGLTGLASRRGLFATRLIDQPAGIADVKLHQALVLAPGTPIALKIKSMVALVEQTAWVGFRSDLEHDRLMGYLNALKTALVDLPPVGPTPDWQESVWKAWPQPCSPPAQALMEEILDLAQTRLGGWHSDRAAPWSGGAVPTKWSCFFGHERFPVLLGRTADHAWHLLFDAPYSVASAFPKASVQEIAARALERAVDLAVHSRQSPQAVLLVDRLIDQALAPHRNAQGIDGVPQDVWGAVMDSVTTTLYGKPSFIGMDTPTLTVLVEALERVGWTPPPSAWPMLAQRCGAIGPDHADNAEVLAWLTDRLLAHQVVPVANEWIGWKVGPTTPSLQAYLPLGRWDLGTALASHKALVLAAWSLAPDLNLSLPVVPWLEVLIERAHRTLNGSSDEPADAVAPVLEHHRDLMREALLRGAEPGAHLPPEQRAEWFAQLVPEHPFHHAWAQLQRTRLTGHTPAALHTPGKALRL